ncbi:MAG TPA: AbrB/MazE/SpoVT family DNA-binding domain-containing protein [Polyangia bacterium]|jgi:antitoxin component of MazEF toxin-antitoxin module
MRTRELKVTRIGNSRGVRLPAEVLRRYRIGAVVLMEEHAQGLLLRATGAAAPQLSWEETARQMAAAGEDWSAWDDATADGMDAIPWAPGEARRAAERPARYRVKSPRRRSP